MRVLDMTRDPRRDQFTYFSAMANPYVGLTAFVDVTAARAWAKRTASSFFLCCLYAVSRAANRVPELRRRIREGQVVEYDWCPSSHTVALENGAYCYCTLRAEGPLETFLQTAAAAQEAAKRHPSLEDGEDAESLLFLSCIPWVSYAALVQPTPVPADSNPRITWGKYELREGRMQMPVTLLAHHALVDGVHIARFYQALEEELSWFSTH